jgi:hypothetical protein
MDSGRVRHSLRSQVTGHTCTSGLGRRAAASESRGTASAVLDSQRSINHYFGRRSLGHWSGHGKNLFIISISGCGHGTAAVGPRADRAGPNCDAKFQCEARPGPPAGNRPAGYGQRLTHWQSESPGLSHWRRTRTPSHGRRRPGLGPARATESAGLESSCGSLS